MSNDSTKESDLQELLAFIRGDGKFKFLGGGISTYPNGDENNRRLFNACLELERRGLIYRHIDTENHVLWRGKREGE